MAEADDSSHPSEDESTVFEATIRRFEADWRQGERPSLGAALSGKGALRTRLLEELLHIDLEFRLKAGEVARVEDYRQYFLEVGFNSALLLSLIQTEATFRRRSEPELRVAHYRARFAEFDGELDRALAGLNASSELPSASVRVVPTRSDPNAPAPEKLGKFEIRQRLGSGEFGVVFRAWDTVLKREVAIKVPRPEVISSPPDLLIFLREARNAIHLRHPNIVAIHDAGPIEGTACVVREYVAGTTLAERLRAAPLAISESVALIAAVLEALAYAHRQGIVHRDLKPSNILLDKDGRPHLTDFGLAKRSTGDSTLSPAGASLVLIGTPAYMSPEQARGDARSVDPRSDIYSVGVLLYELLTGSVPFHGRGRLLQTQIEHAPPIPPRDLVEDIPPALESVCLRALAKHPDERYPTASDMASDLANYVAGRPVVGLEPTARPTPRAASRGRRLALVLFGSGAGLLGLALLGLWNSVNQHRQQDTRLIASLVDNLEALDATAFEPLSTTPNALAVDEDRRRVEAVQGRLEVLAQFLADRPELAAQRVDLLIRHADRITASGDQWSTRRAWGAALVALEPLTRGPGATPRRRQELARGLLLVAELEADAGRLDRCARLAERSSALWEGLAADLQPHPGPSSALRAILLGRAKALLWADRADRLAQRPASLARIEEVERIALSPRDQESWSVDELGSLAEVELALAARALDSNQPSEAARWARAALDLAEASEGRPVLPGLTPPSPGTIGPDAQIARATVLLGLAEASAAHAAPSDLASRQAASAALQLAAIRLVAALAERPNDLSLRRDQVAVERILGQLQLRDGAASRAMLTLRRAQVWNRALRADGPRHQDWAEAARIEADLARVAAATHRESAATAHLLAALFWIGQAERLAPGWGFYEDSFRAYTLSLLQVLVGRAPTCLGTVDQVMPSITSGSGMIRRDRGGSRSRGPTGPGPLDWLASPQPH